MSSRWFRMYDEVLDDPKVQMLSPDTFKAWVNILCLASRNDGRLPDVTAIAFALRLEDKKAEKIISELKNRDLLDDVDGEIIPHAWNDRQYKSDVSTDRVKQHRERKRNVSSTVTGNVSNGVTRNVSKPVSRNGAITVSETRPDTETDTEVESYPVNGADLDEVVQDDGPFTTGLEAPPLGPIALAAIRGGKR